MGIHWFDGSGIWLVGIIPMLLWAVLLVLGIILMVRLIGRNSANQPPPPWGAESAEDVLRRRFAAGEIDEEEYRRRLEVLRR